MTKQFELPRKTVHLMSLLVPVVTYQSVFVAQWVLSGFAVFYFFTEWTKSRGHTSPAHRVISKLHREEELETWARAPLFLALGIMVAISFFSWTASVIGIVHVGLCDTMAAICGKKWGTSVIPFMTRKTFVGMSAYFIFALPVGFYFLSPSKAITLALVGAFLESLPLKDWDNLTIPIGITLLAEQFLHSGA